MPAEATISLETALFIRKLTPDEFAERIQVCRSTVRAWLRGRGKPAAKTEPLIHEVLSAAPVFYDVLPRPELRRVSATPTTKKELSMSLPRLPLSDEMLDYWQLRDDPFDDSPDPLDVWLPARVQGLENALLRSLRRKDFVALAGPSGAGKSTILRRFQARLSAEARVRLIRVASHDRSKITSANIATALVRELTGRDTSSATTESRSEVLLQALMAEAQALRTPVLVLDEAHLLPVDALLGLKQIWDSALVRPLAVIIVGQEALTDRLAKEPRLREVLGRCVLLRVPPLRSSELAEYMKWRWSRASEAPLPFAADALEVLADRSQGVPLWANNLAAAALVRAQRIGDKTVSAAIIGKV